MKEICKLNVHVVKLFLLFKLIEVVIKYTQNITVTFVA